MACLGASCIAYFHAECRNSWQHVCQPVRDGNEQYCFSTDSRVSDVITAEKILKIYIQICAFSSNLAVRQWVPKVGEITRKVSKSWSDRFHVSMVIAVIPKIRRLICPLLEYGPITVWTVVQTVLTTTFNSYGNRQISTPHEINTPERIDKKIGTIDYIRQGTSYTKFGRNPFTGASGKYNKNYYPPFAR